MRYQRSIPKKTSARDSPLDTALIDTVIRETYAVERGLEEASSRTFASEQVALLIAEAKRVARAIRGEFIAVGGKSASDERRLLRLTRVVFAMRHQLLPALEHGSLRSRPHEAMLAIESVLAKALPDTKTVLLALPGAVHSYAERDLWSAIRTQLGPLGLDDVLGTQHLLFLGVEVPTAEKDNVLLHAILCHELGHELVTAYHWADQFLALLPGDEAIRALAADISEQQKFRSLSETEQQTVLASLVARSGGQYWNSGVLANWIAELLADAVALCVLGPAAAFSSAELLSLKLGNDWDPFKPSHPRWALRLKLHRLHLEHRTSGGEPSFEELLTTYAKAYEYLENIQQVYLGEPGQVDEREFEQSDGYTIERTAAFYDALERAVLNKLPEILAAARGDLDKCGLLYTPAMFAAEVPSLIDKLEALIPPSTIGPFGSERPATYAGVMNAGVLARRDRREAIRGDVGRFAALEASERGAGDYETEELIFRLIRKAISDSDIHARWLAAGGVDR